ncbi:MAG: hypothetical protein WBM90_02955, partial [Acidimicrobiia bacterium]
VAAFIGSLVIPGIAQGAEFSSCWVAREINPLFGRSETVTRCRISGGEVIDYSSDADVPSVLYPQMGTDVTGQCWYYTSASTQFLILIQFADGSAEVGFDPDPNTPGPIAVGPVVPRCSSEPAALADPSADAWAYVTQYIHDPPTPLLNPPPGQGITGLDTFVAVEVPDDHTAQIASGSTTLDIFIEVSLVLVDWGDGRQNVYPPTARALSGYPDGGATHIYEQKRQEGSQITVEYDWTARWRVSGGTWESLAVPNTSTTVDYPIAEIVSEFSS